MAERKRRSQPAPAPQSGRNNTSFPAQATARLRQLHARYLAARADAADPDHAWAHQLRYYQWVVRAAFIADDFGLRATGARGLLCYHSMGLGKTRLAAGVALAAPRAAIVMLPRSLRDNFAQTVRAVAKATGPDAARPDAAGPDAAGPDAETDALLAAKFTYVSMDAYNAADQMAAGGLDGKLLIVDEAHNFFRAIINGGPDSNARRTYDMIMAARDLQILFLTGTPAAKDPFELVPCFNMLAGFDLLPPQYDIFYDLYVDRGNCAVKNRDHFANRIVGLVSHVSTARPTNVRGADTTMREARADGWFPAELPTIIERVPMGAFQYRHYLLAREREDAEGGGGGVTGLGAVLAAAPLSLPGAEKKAMRSYYVHSRSLSNFAAPRGRFAAASPAAASPAAASPDATSPDAENELGPKLALVAARAAAAPGPVLVYSQFVADGGLRPLARFLERAGFQPWRPPPKVAVGGAQELTRFIKSRRQPDLVAKSVAKARELMEEFRDMYTAAERELIIERAAMRPQICPSRVSGATDAVGAWYDPQMTIRAPYVAKRAPNVAFAFNLHHGQRKLFVGELQAITCLIARAGSTARSTAKITVVYAGAAPGHHTPFLARLFPQITWHLIDPSEFRMCGGAAEMGRIHTYREFFTDETARKWRGRCDIFISDIRLNSSVDDSGWSQDFEDQVALDMAAQARWTELIQPRLGASLKWRPPYVGANLHANTLRYLRGRVLVQTWPSRSSTEGRLIVSGADACAGTLATYDCAHYQDACAQHNMIDRPWTTYDTIVAPNPSGFDACFDCANEEAAWRAYIGASHADLPDQVKKMMHELTRETHQRLDLGARTSFADIADTLAARKRHGATLHGFEPELPAPLRIAKALRAFKGGASAESASAVSASAVSVSAESASATAQPIRRYAVVSGDVPSEVRAEIVAAFNSPLNMHGAVIKAILVSKTGAEGLDLKWIRETHQLEPYWDRARDDQVRARAVRVGSHDGLPAAEREVQPYLYIATANPKIWNAMPAAAREPATIDEQFHARATERYKLNCAFREVLAEACFECDLFGYAAASADAAAPANAFACRACVPTNAPLWLRDPAADARTPDSCRPQQERTVTATPVELDGVTFYYEEDPASPFGYTFFEERADLGAYAPIDPADSRLPALVREVLR